MFIQISAMLSYQNYHSTFRKVIVKTFVHLPLILPFCGGFLLTCGRCLWRIKNGRCSVGFLSIWVFHGLGSLLGQSESSGALARHSIKQGFCAILFFDKYTYFGSFWYLSLLSMWKYTYFQPKWLKRQKLGNIWRNCL